MYVGGGAKGRGRGRTGVELVECDPELGQAWEELRLGLPVDRVCRP